VVATATGYPSRSRVSNADSLRLNGAQDIVWSTDFVHGTIARPYVLMQSQRT
jgi:hypothetical protein